MFVWFYLHFEREHAKNMHFFDVFPCFCSSNLEFKNACFLHVQNACQSRSPAPFLRCPPFWVEKCKKHQKNACFFPCLYDFTYILWGKMQKTCIFSMCFRTFVAPIKKCLFSGVFLGCCYFQPKGGTESQSPSLILNHQDGWCLPGDTWHWGNMYLALHSECAYSETCILTLHFAHAFFRSCILNIQIPGKYMHFGGMGLWLERKS